MTRPNVTGMYSPCTEARVPPPPHTAVWNSGLGSDAPWSVITNEAETLALGK